jgi:uncharacterized membrane protein YfcA
VSNLFGVLSPRYVLPAFGIFLIVRGVVCTYTGKIYARFHGWVYRQEDPKGFWLEVALGYVLGLGLIGIFLYDWVSN